MGYKKHSWMKYGGGKHIIEVTIRDEARNKVDQLTCNDEEGFKRIMNILKKYGYENKEGNEKKWLDKDLDW